MDSWAFLVVSKRQSMFVVCTRREARQKIPVTGRVDKKRGCRQGSAKITVSIVAIVSRFDSDMAIHTVDTTELGVVSCAAH